jgi:hypothetical protein
MHKDLPTTTQTVDRSQFPWVKAKKFRDEHQKGYVVALSAGVAHYFYNHGQARIAAVHVLYINNNANHLEPRKKETNGI